MEKGSIVKMKKWGFVAGGGEHKYVSVYPWEALRLHWSQKSQRRFWLSCCGQKPCIRAYYDVYYTKDCWKSQSMSHSIFLFKYKDLNSSCQMDTHFKKVFVNQIVKMIQNRSCLFSNNPVLSFNQSLRLMTASLGFKWLPSAGKDSCLCVTCLRDIMIYVLRDTWFRIYTEWLVHRLVFLIIYLTGD